MINRENKNSAINRALNRLEDAHEIKKEESKVAKSAAAVPEKILNSFALPLMQVENILKASQKTFRVVTQGLESRFKRDPWALLGKVAVGCFVLGIIMGYRSQPSKPKGKR